MPPLMTFALLLYIVVRIARLYVERQVIRDAKGDPYLVRYFIFRSRLLERVGVNLGRIYLHHIIRSDHDRALHDHPWNFVSIILKGGYWEHTDRRQTRERDVRAWEAKDGTVMTWYQPGDVLRRGAGVRHRLRLPDGKTAWTLVFTTGKLREWGFWLDGDRFCHWKKYDTAKGQCAE
jgi:hypothetical protein